MQIVIIGTGNVAAILGRKLKLAGHAIVQVFGRNELTASALAAELGAKPCSLWNAITQSAELYIIAIADKALAEIEKQLHLKNQLVVHTAGAVSINVLKNVSSNYGVLYPYQTLRKEIEPIPEIPLLIDANTETSAQQLMDLAKTISVNVTRANDDERMKYHLCAVLTNNFSNYLFTVAADYCQKNGLDFNNLLPLIDETASRLHRFSPHAVQTGPGIRKDLSTIDRHLNLLNNEPGLKNLYKVLSEEILKYPWQVTG